MTARPETGAGESPWRGLFRSFATLAAGESVARLFGLVAVVLMARRLGPGGFGVAVLGTTLVTWFRLVVDSGTEVLSVRETSRTPDRFRKLVEPVLGLRLALSLAAAALFAVAAMAIPGPEAAREALLLFAAVLPMMGLNLRFMVLGLKAARAVALGNVAAQCCLALGVVLLVREPNDLPAVPLLVAAAELLYAGVVMAAVHRRCGVVRPRVDLAVWRRTLAGGLPLAVGGLAGAAKYSLSLLLIAALLARHDLGLYGAAYKPILFFSTLVALLSVSFLSAYSRSPAPERAQLVRRTVGASLLVTVPVAALLSAGSGVAMSVLYGPDYGGSAAALAILAWSLPLLALVLPYGNVLIAADRQAVLMRHQIAGTLVSVAATAATLPFLGLVGAASAAVASTAFVLALNYRSAIRHGLAEPLWGPARGAGAGAQPLPAPSPSGSP